jgi:hypothetical protein
MGTYIFNSECLWAGTTRAAPALNDSDYDKTEELKRAFENI